MYRYLFMCDLHTDMSKSRDTFYITSLFNTQGSKLIEKVFDLLS